MYKYFSFGKYAQELSQTKLATLIAILVSNRFLIHQFGAENLTFTMFLFLKTFADPVLSEHTQKNHPVQFAIKVTNQI